MNTFMLLEPEGRKWLLTNFTGETKQNFDHTSITCIINLKPQTLQPGILQ